MPLDLSYKCFFGYIAEAHLPRWFTEMEGSGRRGACEMLMERLGSDEVGLLADISCVTSRCFALGASHVYLVGKNPTCSVSG